MEYTFRAVTHNPGIIIWRIEVKRLSVSILFKIYQGVYSQSLVKTTDVCISLSSQKMELVQVPEKSLGNFYEGDCYILLSVSPGAMILIRGVMSAHSFVELGSYDLAKCPGVNQCVCCIDYVFFGVCVT